MRKSLLAIIISIFLAFVMCLCGCTLIGTETDEPQLDRVEVSQADNINGAVLSLTKGGFISNINAAIAIANGKISPIEELKQWSTGDIDSIEGEYTFYTNNLTTSDDTPSFDALVYDTSSRVAQVRIDWTIDAVEESPDTFKEYVIVGIMGATGYGQAAAEVFYESAINGIYHDGSQVSLTYYYYEHFRCYCMQSGTYEIFVIEPFSDSMMQSQLDVGVFAFEDISESMPSDVYALSASNKPATTAAPSDATQSDSSSSDPDSSDSSDGQSSDESSAPSRSGVEMDENDRFKGLQ